MNSFGVMRAWTDVPEVPTIEPADLTPGTLENKGLLENKKGAHIYSATATEAIIPITPDPATPTVVTKRVKLDPVKLSNIINSGTLEHV